jgi:hypothetical protein
MDADFYSVTAQIIVVMMLALSIERRAHKELREKNLYGYVSRVHQVYVYVWSTIGLVVSLLHLAGFNFGWFGVGKLTVLVSIFVILLLLVGIYIMGSRQDELQKRGYATVTFLFVPMFLTIGLSYLEFFSDNYIDMIFVNCVTTVVMVIAFVVLFCNKKYLLELQQIIGVAPEQKNKRKG